MNRSLRSVVTVIVSIFIACFGSWLFLRSNAASKPLKPPFAHGFNKIHGDGYPALFFQFQRPQSKESSATLGDLSDLAGLARGTVGAGLWLDVRLNGSSDLVVSSSDLLSNGKPIEIASLEECRADGIVTLVEAAPFLKDTYVVLNLIARRPGLPTKLFEVWGDGKPLSFDWTLVQSESDGILKELREQAPKAFYGSSQATMLQLEILSTLGLEGLPDLKSDALISMIEEPSRNDSVPAPRLRDSTLKEAHRRNLKRYVGPVRTREVAVPLLDAGYDGIVLTERGIWEDLLDERHLLQ